MKDKSAAAGLLLGYARVSTDDQDLTNQRAELHAAGCTRIFAEKITGTRRDRPELARVLDHLRPGDVVTVTRLDRLARGTAEPIGREVSAHAWAVLAARARRGAPPALLGQALDDHVEGLLLGELDVLAQIHSWNLSILVSW